MTKRLLIICLVLGAASSAHAASAALRAGLGIIERSGGPDLMPRVGANARLDNGLQFHVQLGGIFTSEQYADGSSNGNHVYEWQLMGGLGWRFGQTEKYYLDGVMLVGPLFRQFPEQLRTGIALAAPFTFGIRITDEVAIELRGGPGYEKKAAVYNSDGSRAWYRGHLTVEAGAMICYDFEPFAGSHRPVDF